MLVNNPDNYDDSLQPIKEWKHVTLLILSHNTCKVL